MIVDKLVTILGFEATGKEEVKELEKRTEALKEAVLEASDMILKFASSVSQAVLAVNDAVTDIQEWANSVDASADAYQRLAHAAQMFGAESGDLDSIRKDLESISGFTAPEDQFEYFARLADSIEGIGSNYQKQMALSQISSESLKRALMAGGAEFRRMGKEAMVMGRDQMNASVAFSRALRQITLAWNELTTHAISKAFSWLSVALNRIASAFMSLSKVITPVFIKYAQTLGAIIASVVTPLAWVLGFLADLISVIDKMTGGLLSWGAGIAAAVASVWALEFALTVLATKTMMTLQASYLKLIPVFNSFHGQLMTTTLCSKICSVALGILKGVVHLLKLTILGTPVGWILVAIAAVIGIVILLYKNLDKVQKAWEWTKNATIGAVKAVWNGLKSFWNWVKNLYQSVNDMIERSVVLKFLWNVLVPLNGIIHAIKTVLALMKLLRGSSGSKTEDGRDIAVSGSKSEIKPPIDVFSEEVSPSVKKFVAGSNSVSNNSMYRYNNDSRKISNVTNNYQFYSNTRISERRDDIVKGVEDANKKSLLQFMERTGG